MSDVIRALGNEFFLVLYLSHVESIGNEGYMMIGKLYHNVFFYHIAIMLKM